MMLSQTVERPGSRRIDPGQTDPGRSDSGQIDSRQTGQSTESGQVVVMVALAALTLIVGLVFVARWTASALSQARAQSVADAVALSAVSSSDDALDAVLRAVHAMHNPAWGSRLVTPQVVTQSAAQLADQPATQLAVQPAAQLAAQPLTPSSEQPTAQAVSEPAVQRVSSRLKIDIHPNLYERDPDDSDSYDSDADNWIAPSGPFDSVFVEVQLDEQTAYAAAAAN